MKDTDQFKHIFWLTVYVETIGFLLLGGLIWIPVPQENQSMANLAMGFITATIIGVPLAYIYGGNPGKQKQQAADGTTTADISATITTTPEAEPKPIE